MSLITQYLHLKENYNEYLILFRCGDFYECYEDDAKDAAKILGITLCKQIRDGFTKIYMAGFPRHALDTYLPQLIRAGKEVAIIDEKPVELITPIKETFTEFVKSKL